MRAYDARRGRGQLGRLRRWGGPRSTGIRATCGGARLVLLRHEQNATFRVDGDGARYVLRINRPGLQSEATVESEMAWLAALRRDTDLVVPEPVATRDGSLVVTVADPGVPGARCCALLRWIDGRFVNRRLTPAHLARMGDTMGRLQAHAAGWTPPDGFIRQRLDTLTAEAKLASPVGPRRRHRRRSRPSRTASGPSRWSRSSCRRARAPSRPGPSPRRARPTSALAAGPAPRA